MAYILVKKCVKNGWTADEPEEMMEESLLVKTSGVIDDDNEYTTWEKWSLDGKYVKEAAHITLKKGLVVEGIVASFG